MLVVASPIDACQPIQHPPKPKNASDYVNYMYFALIRRGICNFNEKVNCTYVTFDLDPSCLWLETRFSTLTQMVRPIHVGEFGIWTSSTTLFKMVFLKKIEKNFLFWEFILFIHSFIH